MGVAQPLAWKIGTDSYLSSTFGDNPVDALEHQLAWIRQLAPDTCFQLGSKSTKKLNSAKSLVRH